MNENKQGHELLTFKPALHQWPPPFPSLRFTRWHLAHRRSAEPEQNKGGRSERVFVVSHGGGND
jgi:hypothetical protein